jgi:hypothetical protein
VAGACQPLLVGPNSSAAFDLAVDEASLYYTLNKPGPNGALIRIDKVSGTPSAIVSGADSVQRVKVVGSQIYFTVYDVGWTLKACDKAAPTCAPVTLVRSGYVPDFQVTATTLYFTDWDNGNVNGCALATCDAGATPISGFEPRPWAIAIDANRVYWSNVADDRVGGGSIRACALGGCPTGPATLKGNLTSPLSMTKDATRVYWASRSDAVDAGGTSVVAGCPTDSCEAEAADFVFPSIPAAGATRLFVDAKEIIWGETGPGTIYRCAVPDCAGGARALVKLRSGLSAVTADDDFVYFVDAAGIWRVAR